MELRDLTTPGAGRLCTLVTGDVLVSATWREGEVDLRRNMGAGRVLHFDAMLKPKGVLWTGAMGLIAGLAVSHVTGRIYVCDTAARQVYRFERDGTPAGTFEALAGISIGCVDVAPDGTLVFGEHLKSDRPGLQGEGRIFGLSESGECIFADFADRDPGKLGFHGVTNLKLTDGRRSVTYISETGQRIMRFDLRTGQQLADLFSLEGDTVAAGLDLLKDGTVVLATVMGAGLYDPEGALIRDLGFPPERGWAPIRVSRDETAVYAANFFTGAIQKRAIADGTLLAENVTGVTFTTAGIAIVP